MAEAITADLVASLTDVAQTNKSVSKELSTLTEELKKILVQQKANTIKSDVKTPEPSQDKSATDIALERKEPAPVIINDVSTEAYKKLEGLFEKVTGKPANFEPTTPKKEPSSSGSKGLLSGLLEKSGFGKALTAGLLPAIAGLGTSLALAIGSWFNEGPWKGTMKVVGEIGTKVFLPKVTKILTQFFPKLFDGFAKGIQGLGKSVGGTITKLLPTTGMLGKLATKFLGFFTPLLKRLPVIGTIINIGSAISRFMKGDIIGGLIDLGSAIAVLIPGVGTVISIALGFLNAGRDLTGESKKPVAQQVGSIGSILGKALDWVTDKFKKLFNYYFGKIGRGIDQIKSGDYIRGIVTLASFVPGFWWMESVYNWLAGPPPEKPKEEGKKETLPSDVVSKAWDWIKDKFSKILLSVFSKFSTGWKQIKSGEYIQGIVTWASIIPGFSWLDPLYSWLTKPAPSGPKEEQKEPEQPNILSKAWDWIKDKTKNIFTTWFSKLGKGWEQIKAGNYFQGVVTWASMIPGLGWLEPLYNWAVKPEPAPEQETAKGEQGFDWKKIFNSIKDSIKKKLKDVLSSLKKLPFVPDSLVDKIGGFLGISEGQATETPAVAQSTDTTASQATKPAVAGTEALAAVNVPTSQAEVAKTTTSAAEQRVVQEQQAVAQQAEETLSKVNAQQAPQVPLPVTPSTSTANEALLKKMDELLGKVASPKEAKSSTSSFSSNTVANADNSSINVYNSGSDRDIPYVERNKYRQQLLYVRGIL